MNGHDTDPTPPHGTERPPTPTHDLDLRGKYENTLGKVHAFTDHDRAVLLTVTDALDALALAIWAFHHGDESALRDALVESGRDWFGWNTCDLCGEDHHRDDLTDHDGDEVCASCFADLDDDQDRDAYGAPYGGRDDLDESAPLPFTPCPACAEIVDALVEGVCRECHDCGLRSLAPCEFGHFDCATEEGGRCSNLRDALDRVGEIIEANADRLSAVLDD